MIFLNYRHKGSSDLLTPIEKRLREEFGDGTVAEPHVVRDQSELAGSQSLPQDIEGLVRRCEVFVVVIGPQWVEARHENGPLKGVQKLFDPEDWIRREILWAEESDRRIVPVLVGDAEQPEQGTLNMFGFKKLPGCPSQSVRGRHVDTELDEFVDLICKLSPTMAAIREQRRSQKVADGRGFSDPQPRRLLPLRHYLDSLQTAIANVELLGLRLQHGQSVTLNSVYVPLITTPPQAEPVEEREEDSESEKSDRIRDEQPPPTLLLSLLDQKSLYVAGPAGSGKSTFCRWVAWLACAGALPDVPVVPPEGYAETFPESFRGRLPVLVPLREFWHELPKRPGCELYSEFELKQALGQWIERTRPHGLERPVFEGHLQQGTVLLILDGVDEVPINDGATPHVSPIRRPLVAGLGPACAAWTKSNNRVLITSRPYGVTEAETRQLGLSRQPIVDMDEPLQEFLVQRWYRCLVQDPPAAEREAEQMLDHVRQRRDLQELIPNPMLLTATCIVYHQGRRLPQDRHELYSEIVRYVLHNRYANEPNTITAVRYRLGFLAEGMHTGERLGDERPTPQAEIHETEIDTLLAACRNIVEFTDVAAQEVASVREDLLSKSGLFLPQGEENAGFYHPTIQDFFAAERLLKRYAGTIKTVFLTRGVVAEWHSTLNFLCGAIAHDVEQLNLLLHDLTCELPDGAWNLALVVWDAVQIAASRKLAIPQTVQDRLVAIALDAIEREAPLAQRHELGLALGHLGDPRLVEDLRTGEGFVTIPADSYPISDKKTPFRLTHPLQMSKYLVTNSQYALFLREGGYQQPTQPTWWSDEGWKWLVSRNREQPRLWTDSRWNGPNQPVVGVSYYEAEAFARWAGCRLPTANESEAAARGPQGLEYPWGNDWKDGICNSAEAQLGQTSTVGLFAGSRSRDFGLEDCAGNVWEWCDEQVGGVSRVYRGGGWDNHARYVRCAVRGHDPADYQDYYLGFRLVRVQES
jgi:hypothetical protein